MPSSASGPNAANFPLHSILDGISSAISLLDLEWRYTYVNAEAEIVTGLTKEELLGKRVWDLFPAALGTEFEAEARRAMAQQRPTSFEYFFPTFNRWYENRFYPTPQGLLYFTTDITERRRLDEQVRETEKQYRHLFEATHDGILILDEANRCVDANESLCRILRASRQQLIGSPLPDFLPEDRAGEAVEAFANLSAGRSRQVEFPMRALDGSIVELEWSSSTEYLPNLSFYVCRDITERHRSQIALRESEERLRLAHSAAGIGAWEWDLRTGLVIWSKETYDLLGIPSSTEASLEEWRRHIHPKDRELAFSRAEFAIANNETLDSEFRIVRADGAVRWVLSRGTVFRDATGKPVRVIGLNQDITYRREADSAVRTSESRFRRIFETAGVAIFDEDFSAVTLKLSVLRQEGVEDLRSYLQDRPQFLEETSRLVIIRDVNRAALRLCGVERKEQLQMSLSDILLPETIAVFKEQILTIWDGKSSFQAETVIRTPSGELRNVALTMELPDADPNLTSVLVSLMDITPLKEAEALARESDERQRTAVNAGKVGLWDWDIPGDHVTWSDRIYELHGLEPGTFGGSVKDFAAIVHPVDADHVAGALKSALAGESEYRAEYRPVRPDGATYWIATSGEVTFDSEGRPIRMHGAAIDVTDRKRAELRDAFLVRLDDATRPLTDPSEITQTAARFLGEYLAVNRCAYADVLDDENTFDITGDFTRDVASAVGRYRFDQFGAECLRLMRDGRPFVIEDSETDPRASEVVEAYRAMQIAAALRVPLRKAGRLVAGIAVHQATPRKWRSDEIELVQLVANRCWESIERARVARNFRDSERRLRLAQRAGRIGTFEWLIPEQRVVWSPELEALYGVPEGTFEGTFSDWSKRVVPEDTEIVTAGIRDIVARRQAEYSYEFRAILPDGSHRWLRGQAQFFFDDAGRPTRMIGINIDVHDKKRAEKELEALVDALREANQGLEEFAYVASHDMQEPLRMVNTYTQMLLRKHVDAQNEEALKYAEFIRTGVRRMERLIQDLLSYSRIIHTERHPTGEAELSVALTQALEVLKARVAEANAIVTHNCLPKLAGDEAQLAQVFQNLVSNSLKYRKPDESPRIHISAERFDHEWIITVQDNGIGFDEKYAEHIFGLFKRLHKDEYPGTGLGLAICKRTIDRHGGRMWAHSVPGEGSTFFFSLPA